MKKMEAPDNSYDTKDVCRYTFRKLTPVKSSKLSAEVEARPGSQQYSSIVSSKQLQSEPYSPLASSEHAKLTEIELRWLGSLSNYVIPQVILGYFLFS